MFTLKYCRRIRRTRYEIQNSADAAPRDLRPDPASRLPVEHDQSVFTAASIHSATDQLSNTAGFQGSPFGYCNWTCCTLLQFVRVAPGPGIRETCEVRISIRTLPGKLAGGTRVPPEPPQGAKERRLRNQSNFLATRNPSLMFRFPGVFPKRSAERRNHGSSSHEPPRRTRAERSPPDVQALSSVGAPA